MRFLGVGKKDREQPLFPFHFHDRKPSFPFWVESRWSDLTEFVILRPLAILSVQFQGQIDGREFGSFHFAALVYSGPIGLYLPQVCPAHEPSSCSFQIALIFFITVSGSGPFAIKRIFCSR